jgi:hypothetical protein
VCLDERSTGPLVAEAARKILSNDTGSGRVPSQAPPSDEQARIAVEASSARALADVLRAAERPAWEILAADVRGLPWTGRQTHSASYGTWGRHLACGTVSRLGPRGTDCPACGSGWLSGH